MMASISKKDNETTYYFDKCACCLEDGLLKDMWGQYIHDGEVEIYGEMLSEYISQPLLDLYAYAEQICDKCIIRLRDSLAFRREVLASKEVLEQLKEGRLDVGDVVVKVETMEETPAQDDTEESQGEESMVSEEGSEYLEDDKAETGDEEGTDTEMVTEYLEEEIIGQGAVLTEKPTKPRSKSIYKQYTQLDLQQAMDLVLSERMSVAEAAAKFNIPGKTLRAKVKKRETGEADDGANSETKKSLEDFYNEIRTVLTYTNATPYKTKVGRYYCAYCTTQGPKFLDVNELRTHTRTVHAVDRIKNVDFIMRPTYLNEVLKLDIYRLQCTVCMLDIPEWNIMFEHFKDTHNVVLQHAYTRIIPFILDVDCACALCHKAFNHYHLLDVHMNAHYNNYICGECGDTFLSETRLKKHSEIHSTRRHPCKDCGKEFSLEKYRKKHHDFVHLKEQKFKCAHCDEIFNSAYLRHQHLGKVHNQTIKIFECEFCEMTFTWRPYYLKHKRLNHSMTFQCKLCPKRFRQKHEIKNHLLWHKGTGYTCEKCGRKFSSKNYLNKHVAACGYVPNEDEEVIVFQVS